MERLTPHMCSMFWKVSVIVIIFVVSTSVLSNKCHEDDTLSRKHIINYKNLLRTAMESSLRATQTSNSYQKYKDVVTAKISIDILVDMLTEAQLRVISSNIDIIETREVISAQYEEALLNTVQTK